MFRVLVDLLINVFVLERLAIALIVASAIIIQGIFLVKFSSFHIVSRIGGIFFEFAYSVELVDTFARHTRRELLQVVGGLLLQKTHGNEDEHQDNEHSEVDGELINFDSSLANLQVLPEDVGGLGSVNNLHLYAIADDRVVVAVLSAVLVVLVVCLLYTSPSPRDS